MASTQNLPSRLHHTAYVSSNLEATRKFYEDLPLLATWCESDMLFGAERTYAHCFFGLADGSALAFFQFVRPEDQKLFGPKMPESPFHHVALNVNNEVQAGIEKRLREAGYTEPKIYILEHGYCRSLYVADPDGMICEFTVDHPDVEKINALKLKSAHADLEAWLSGNHKSNNMFRTESP